MRPTSRSCGEEVNERRFRQPHDPRKRQHADRTRSAITHPAMRAASQRERHRLAFIEPLPASGRRRCCAPNRRRQAGTRTSRDTTVDRPVPDRPARGIAHHQPPPDGVGHGKCAGVRQQGLQRLGGIERLNSGTRSGTVDQEQRTKRSGAAGGPDDPDAPGTVAEVCDRRLPQRHVVGDGNGIHTADPISHDRVCRQPIAPPRRRARHAMVDLPAPA